MTSSASAAVSVPEWMTKEYFVDAIAVKLGKPATDFTITDLDVRRATEAGDNYASILYRVRVSVRLHNTDGTPMDISLIVKALPKLSLTDEMVKMMNLFPKEIAMYTDVLPRLEQLYHQAGRTSVHFGPRCLKHSTEPTDVIVLEDLRERQFTMANRRQGLDMEHTRLVLRRMAQFHAASVVLEDHRGPYGELFREGMFTEKGRAMSEQFQKGQADFFQKIMGCWSEKAQQCASVMVRIGLFYYCMRSLVTCASLLCSNIGAWICLTR